MASDDIACRVLIQNEQLEQVNTFTYLGFLIIDDGECTTEFHTRLNRGQARSGHNCRKYGKVTAYRFQRKYDQWKRQWPVATYGCESWTLRRNKEQCHARRRGRSCTARMDNIKTWTGLTMEEKSIRMAENRYRPKWRMYVHGVANPRIEDGWRTEQNRTPVDIARSVVCVSGTQVSCVKMAEPIVSWFRWQVHVGWRNHVLDGVQIPVPPQEGALLRGIWTWNLLCDELVQSWRPLSCTTRRNRCDAAASVQRSRQTSAFAATMRPVAKLI